MSRGEKPTNLGLADDVLARAVRAGASEAEVLVMTDDSQLTRFANSEIHQNVAESNVAVNLRFVHGRRMATASTGRTDDKGLAALVERAAAIARTVEELEDWGGLPGPDPGSATSGLAAAYSTATAEASPELRAEGVRAVIAAADDKGVLAYGSFSTSREGMAVANSTGIRVSEERTAAQLLTVHMSPDGGTGYAERAATDVTNIDPAGIGREAADRARATDHAISVPPGDYPVILEPYAVVDILDMLGYVGFSALAVQEGRSFMEPGRRVGSGLVTIVDDAANQSGLPMSFDYEGVRKQPVTLIERGVCRDVVYDAQTAARAGRRSTGHGLPAPNSYGPFPLNMVMTKGTKTREELIGGMERGLLVTRFHYTNPVHPKLAIITGMTRDGTFLIEGGQVVAPVKNLRFTQSYLDALAGVSAVSRDLRTLRGSFGAVVVPMLRIDSWTFTGATEH
ncbi:MAG: TldD/PmbA family protein [Chloroflexota bacterium]